MTSGFLQLLMMAAGRTSLEATVLKGSGTMGGRENVSKELRETGVRFGEMVKAHNDERGNKLVVDGRSSTSEEDLDRIDAQHNDSRQTNEVKTACRVEVLEESNGLSRRARFGMVDEASASGSEQ